MPFTFSHAAAVLPFARFPKRWQRQFSMTGLIIGSFTPDFEYFFRMRIKSIYSHTLEGLLWFDLPVGLLLAFVFHNLVRDSLIDNLPTFLRSRLAPFGYFDWNDYFKKNWLVVIVSILIGAATHIFWDAFTHRYAYFVGVIPALSNQTNFFGTQVPLYRMIQHISTAVGGIIVAIVICMLPNQGDIRRVGMGADLPPRPPVRSAARYWIIATLITSCIIAIRFSYGLNITEYGDVAATIIPATFIALILTPWLAQKRSCPEGA